MKKSAMLGIVLVLLFFSIAFNACAPTGLNEDCVFILENQKTIASYKIDCDSTLFLVAGQKAYFGKKFEVKSFSGDIIVRERVMGGGVFFEGTQIDTYAEGEGSITFEVEGTKCTLKVIVKPSPYARPRE